MSQQGFFAEGTIQPCRFVAPSLSYNFKVKAAGAGDSPFGITADDTLKAPLDGAATYHAASGDPVAIYGVSEECLLELGSGGCTRGDWLKPTTGGLGIVGTLASDSCGARAYESGVEGQLIRVLVTDGSR